MKFEIVEKGRCAFEVDMKEVEPEDLDKFYLEVWVEGETVKVCLDHAFEGEFRRVNVTAEI